MLRIRTQRHREKNRLRTDLIRPVGTGYFRASNLKEPPPSLHHFILRLFWWSSCSDYEPSSCLRFSIIAQRNRISLTSRLAVDKIAMNYNQNWMIGMVYWQFLHKATFIRQKPTLNHPVLMLLSVVLEICLFRLVNLVTKILVAIVSVSNSESLKRRALLSAQNYNFGNAKLVFWKIPVFNYLKLPNSAYR